MIRLVKKSVAAIVPFSILLLIAGYVVTTAFGVNFSIGSIAIMLLAFSLISVITLLIFFRGQTKEAESQTFHSLVAISLKFLLEIVFALCWFIFAKKTSPESIVVFFVLYLCLSLFSVFIILRTLKNRAL